MSNIISIRYLFSTFLPDYDFSQYLLFIEECKKKVIPNDTYTEKHHIFTKSMIKKYINSTDPLYDNLIKGKNGYDWNLIDLSIRDHVEAHKIMALTGEESSLVTWAVFGSLVIDAINKGIFLNKNNERYKNLTQEDIYYFSNDIDTIISLREKAYKERSKWYKDPVNIEYLSEMNKKRYAKETDEEKEKRKLFYKEIAMNPEVRKSISDGVRNYYDSMTIEQRKEHREITSIRQSKLMSNSELRKQISFNSKVTCKIQNCFVKEKYIEAKQNGYTGKWNDYQSIARIQFCDYLNKIKDMSIDEKIPIFDDYMKKYPEPNKQSLIAIRTKESLNTPEQIEKRKLERSAWENAKQSGFTGDYNSFRKWYASQIKIKG